MPEFVIATFNRDKGRELAALLGAPGRRLRFLYEFPGAASPEEHGATLLENARIKAEAARRDTGLPAIADDTGLEVDALGGEPGVRAARFAGPNATYADNVALLLERLRGVARERRTARFRTVCVACFPDGSERVGEGVLEGVITEVPRGESGFGYDPVFEVADPGAEGRGRTPAGAPGDRTPVAAAGRTLAELDEAAKNALSHRALAVRALARALEASS